MTTARNLGGSGLTVSALGLGCMGMSYAYGPTDHAESIATIHRALDLGITFLDTADVYGDGDNEKLVGEAITGRRDEVVLATKFGILRTNFTGRTAAVNGSPDYVRAAIDGSLRRLKVDHVDLYYQHRLDPDVPVEETVGAMAELSLRSTSWPPTTSAAPNPGGRTATWRRTWPWSTRSGQSPAGTT